MDEWAYCLPRELVILIMDQIITDEVPLYPFKLVSHLWHDVAWSRLKSVHWSDHTLHNKAGDFLHVLTLAKNLHHLKLGLTERSLELPGADRAFLGASRQDQISKTRNQLFQQLGEMTTIKSLSLNSEMFNSTIRSLSAITSLHLHGSLSTLCRYSFPLCSLKHLSLWHEPPWKFSMTFATFLDRLDSPLESLEFVFPSLHDLWKRTPRPLDLGPVRIFEDLTKLVSNQTVENVPQYTHLQILKLPRLTADPTPLQSLRKLSLKYYENQIGPLCPWIEVLHLDDFALPIFFPKDLKVLKIKQKLSRIEEAGVFDLEHLQKLAITLPRPAIGRQPSPKPIRLNPNLHTFKLIQKEWNPIISAIVETPFLTRLKTLHLIKCATPEIITSISYLTDLTDLNLEACKLPGGQFGPVLGKFLFMDRLSLVDTNLNNQDLVILLKNMFCLQHLNISKCKDVGGPPRSHPGPGRSGEEAESPEDGVRARGDGTGGDDEIWPLLKNSRQLWDFSYSLSGLRSDSLEGQEIGLKIKMDTEAVLNCDLEDFFGDVQF